MPKKPPADVLEQIFTPGNRSAIKMGDPLEPGREGSVKKRRETSFAIVGLGTTNEFH